jgi:hypothetical protein
VKGRPLLANRSDAADGNDGRPDLLGNASSAALSLIIESLAFQFAFFGMGRASA